MEGTTNARTRYQILKQSVINNDITRVEELLNIGMDVNMFFRMTYPVNFMGINHIITNFKTLLMIACSRSIDNIDMIKLLINYGADVNKDGRDDHIKIVNISNPPLIQCIFHNKIDALKLLLKNGADPNIYSIHDGKTPLHFCVNDDRYEMVEILLKYGSDPYIEDNDGETAYQYAVNRNADIIVDLMEKHKNLQEAEQKLAFMSSLNPRLGVNAFNKTNYDLYKKIADIPIEYDSVYNSNSVFNRVYNRKILEEHLNDLTRARQLSKTMRGMETSAGPFGAKSVKYEPNIMEGIFGHLSNMRPDARVHTRIDQQNKKTKKRKRR